MSANNKMTRSRRAGLPLVTPRERPAGAYPSRLHPQPTVGDNLERKLAQDLVGVFSTSAPEVDLVALGFSIADLGRQRGAQGGDA
jgi:hypothetical protein